jgi:hypothetical protein
MFLTHAAAQPAPLHLTSYTDWFLDTVHETAVAAGSTDVADRIFQSQVFEQGAFGDNSPAARQGLYLGEIFAAVALGIKDGVYRDAFWLEAARKFREFADRCLIAPDDTPIRRWRGFLYETASALEVEPMSTMTRPESPFRTYFPTFRT